MSELLNLTIRYFKNKIKNKLMDKMNLATQFCDQLKLGFSKCEI